MRHSAGLTRQQPTTPLCPNSPKLYSFSSYRRAFYFSYLQSINSLLFETMQLTIFPILGLSAWVVTTQFLDGDSAQTVIKEHVEDQKYLIRLPTGERKWVTEADKWRLREVFLVFSNCDLSHSHAGWLDVHGHHRLSGTWTD
jgi:hypothetical protein